MLFVKRFHHLRSDFIFTNRFDLSNCCPHFSCSEDIITVLCSLSFLCKFKTLTLKWSAPLGPRRLVAVVYAPSIPNEKIARAKLPLRVKSKLAIRCFVLGKDS